MGYIRMVERGCRLPFLNETNLSQVIGHGLRPQTFKSDKSVQTGILGLEHNPHPALAEPLEDYVLSNPLIEELFPALRRAQRGTGALRWIHVVFCTPV